MNELVKPSFDLDIEVKLPENMPEIEHNLDILKEKTMELKDFYSTLVIKESDIKDAESECTKLNKLKDQVKRLRIDTIAKYKEPIDDFEKTAKSIEGLLDEAKGTIKNTLDIYTEKKQQEKVEKVIKPLINNAVSNAFCQGYLINSNDIIPDKRWFNKTIKDSEIELDVNNQVQAIIDNQKSLNDGISTITKTINMIGNPNLNVDIYVERFKYTRDLQSILNDIESDNKRQVLNQVNTQLNKSIVEEPLVGTIVFKGTIDQINSLRAYAKTLGMEEL